MRVSVATPRPAAHVGILQGLSNTAVMLQTDAGALALPRRSVTRLERSLGRKRSVLGGVLGFLAGAMAGGTLGCLANRDDYGVFCGGQSDATVVAGALIGAAAGTAAGGALLRRERWSTVDLSAPP